MNGQVNKVDSLGQKQGVWNYYNNDLELWFIENYANDTLHGKMEVYFKNKNKFKEMHIHKGRIEGEAITYYKNGSLESEMTYANDSLNGISTLYDKKNNLVSETNFANSKEDGLCVIYYSNGEIAVKKNYKNGMLDGVLIAFDKQGIKIHEATFKNGIEIGESYFYEKGELKKSYTIDELGNYNLITTYSKNGDEFIETLNNKNRPKSLGKLYQD